MHALCRTAAPLAAALIAACSPPPLAQVSFARDIRPVLERQCLPCHASGGPGSDASGLRLDGYAALLAGTRLGAVIVPGDAASSTLYRVAAGLADPRLRMPHAAPPLDSASLDALRRWIDSGAQDN